MVIYLLQDFYRTVFFVRLWKVFRLNWKTWNTIKCKDTVINGADTFVLVVWIRNIWKSKTIERDGTLNSVYLIMLHSKYANVEK